MADLQPILHAQMMQRLGWTLVHFLWQATAVGLILGAILSLLHRSSANLRYTVACTALAMMVFMPMATMMAMDGSLQTIAATMQPVLDWPQANSDVQAFSTAPPTIGGTVQPRVSLQDQFVEIVEPALPCAVLAWLVGVLGLSIWHLHGWRQLKGLRQQMVEEVTPALVVRLQQLSDRLGIQRTVGIVESALVQVPSVVGYLKPVILLPASALTGLGPKQIEAILAHELAHIKRGDYLVNMLQTVVEILGFYHPAVWWVSGKIRMERENCCDDLAVSLSGDRLAYARALTRLEEIRADRFGLAVAVSGGSLLQRIQRLVGKDSADQSKRSWLPCVVAILLAVAVLIPTALVLADEKAGQIDAKSETSKRTEDAIEPILEDSDEIVQAAQALFDNIRNADYERILSYYRNGRWKRDGWKRLLPSDKCYMTHTDFPSWVRWICDTFNDNPIVFVELGKVFASDKEISGFEGTSWPTVPYKLILKDGGTIKGGLLFRYMPAGKPSLFRPAKAYWMGMLGLDWHLQKDVIQKPSVQIDIQNEEAIIAAFWELANALKSKDLAALKKIAQRQAKAFDISSDEEYGTLLLDAGVLQHYQGIAGIRMHTMEKQYNQVNVLTSTITDPRGIAGRLSFGFLDEQEPALVGTHFVTYVRKQRMLRPQILTNAYILGVPATLGQAEELSPAEKPGSRMLSSEEVEKLLLLVRDHPEAEVVSQPKMLSNDGEIGEMSTENMDHPDVTRFECKSKFKASPDRQRIRLDVELKYAWDESNALARGTSEIATTATVRSGYAIALSGTVRKNGRRIIFLIQPSILEPSDN